MTLRGPFPKVSYILVEKVLLFLPSLKAFCPGEALYSLGKSSLSLCLSLHTVNGTNCAADPCYTKNLTLEGLVNRSDETVSVASTPLEDNPTALRDLGAHVALPLAGVG